MSTRPSGGAAAGGEIGALELVSAFARHKYLLFFLPLVAAGAGAIGSGMVAPEFTATSRIVLQQKRQVSRDALNARAGLLGQLFGASGQPGATVEWMEQLVRSRTIADRLIERFDLGAHYALQPDSRVRERLRKATMIRTNIDNSITIDVDDQDPAMAAKLANGYVEELDRMTAALSMASARAQREFFEEQARIARSELLGADVAARGLAGRGAGGATSMAESRLASSARLRMMKSSLEVSLDAMQVSASRQNPEIVRMVAELGAINRELARLESGEGGTMPAPGPAYGSLELRLARLAEARLLYLTQQSGLARLDEALPGSAFKVIDTAALPDRKAKPWRAVIVLFSGMTGLCLAMFIALLRDTMRKGIPRGQSRVPENGLVKLAGGST